MSALPSLSQMAAHQPQSMPADSGPTDNDEYANFPGGASVMMKARRIIKGHGTIIMSELGYYLLALRQ